MTDRSQASTGSWSAPTVDPDRSSRVGPEQIALVLSMIVVLTVGGGVLAGVRLPGGGPAGPAPFATPSVTARPSATPEPNVNVAAVTVCLQIDARLIADREALRAELDAAVFEPSNVAAILRSANYDLIQATDVAAHLGPTGTASALSGELVAFYSDLHTTISDGLVNSVRNAPAYQALATEVTTRLKAVEAYDRRLNALLRSDVPPVGASGSPLPTASSGPGASPLVSPTPPRPTPAGTPSPSAGPGSSAGPPAAGGLVNPGFEAGVGAPWELVVTAPALASLSEDRTVRAGGSAAARIDITTAGAERAAVALRQGGLLIDAGSHYVVTLAVRAATPREVRIRIASATGETYGTRLFTIGSTWQTLTLDATVLASDANAYLEVDLGRFPVTTWIDDTTFSRVVATGG